MILPDRMEILRSDIPTILSRIARPLQISRPTGMQWFDERVGDFASIEFGIVHRTPDDQPIPVSARACLPTIYSGINGD